LINKWFKIHFLAFLLALGLLVCKVIKTVMKAFLIERKLAFRLKKQKERKDKNEISEK